MSSSSWQPADASAPAGRWHTRVTGLPESSPTGPRPLLPVAADAARLTPELDHRMPANVAAEVAVLVPVYRMPLAPADLLVLQQVRRVLGAHPRILVAPEGLELGTLPRAFGMQVERFAAHHFDGIRAYNGLMLDPAFYQRFSRFTWVLVHQLDAWVFRDELAHWCARPYDYLGAPWTFKDPRAYRGGSMSYLYRRLMSWCARRGLQSGGEARHRRAIREQVGNGGLSLRRVRAFLEVLNDPPSWIERYRSCDHTYAHEDVFWGVAVNQSRLRIRTPGWSEALRFSVELNPRACVAYTAGELPFGCHAWNRKDPAFWAQHIPALHVSAVPPTACAWPHRPSTP